MAFSLIFRVSQASLSRVWGIGRFLDAKFFEHDLVDIIILGESGSLKAQPLGIVSEVFQNI
jgi:hypothetical protein